MSDVKDILEENIDMIAATSVLQQQAGDIRSRTINWLPYVQSQMISQADYQCITALDKNKGSFLVENTQQSIKTLLNLLSHVSKDSTIQYVLVLIDDMLQEDRSRVDLFHDYAVKQKECIWGPFLNLLNRQDGFIVNMSSRILAKLACWGHERMPKSDLNFYLQFLKDQLTVNAKTYIKEMAVLSSRVQTIVTHQSQHGGGSHHHHNSKDNHQGHHQYSPPAAAASKQYQQAMESYREVSADQQQQITSGSEQNLIIPVLCIPNANCLHELDRSFHMPVSFVISFSPSPFFLPSLSHSLLLCVKNLSKNEQLSLTQLVRKTKKRNRL